MATRIDSSDASGGLTNTSANAAPIQSPSRPTVMSHSRTMSTMPPTTETPDVAPRSNRFSMSFPVQLSRTTSPVRVSQSPTREAPSVVPESLAALSGSADSNFLTAIAAQERRVLELKEELGKAEAELNRLKRQWAQHEAQKKRDDVKRLTKLQPVRTSLPPTDTEDDIDGSNAWMQQEMERRKALLQSNVSSSRTVFSGSKHMRTLSLLSPAARESPATHLPARPSRKESSADVARLGRHISTQSSGASQLPRVSTTPDLPVDRGDPSHVPIEEMENALDKDMLIRTSKKMATDFRDGILTFWEDLRQAAVGEEARKVEPTPRKQSSGSNLRAAKRQSSKTSLSAANKSTSNARRDSPKPVKSAPPEITTAPGLTDLSFWSDHGIPLDQQATPAKVKKSSPAVRHAKSVSKVSSIASSDNDAWDAWDESSPHGSRTSSAASESNTAPSTVSNAATPRTSSDIPKALDWSARRKSGVLDSDSKDPIPWPALANLGPKALRRTASHLMAEWEKSLTPSPTRTGAEPDDYLGLGAEAAAVAVPADRKKD